MSVLKDGWFGAVWVHLVGGESHPRPCNPWKVLEKPRIGGFSTLPQLLASRHDMTCDMSSSNMAEFLGTVSVIDL